MNDDESIKVVTEQAAIDALGLADRPNPRSALRWLLRTKQLGYVRLGRGIIGFRRVDIEEFIGSLRRIEYDGPVVAEPFNKAVNEMEDEPAAKLTAESIQKILA